jgi:hypothetical protein
MNDVKRQNFYTPAQEKNQPHTAASACAKNAGSAGV